VTQTNTETDEQPNQTIDEAVNESRSKECRLVFLHSSTLLPNSADVCSGKLAPE